MKRITLWFLSTLSALVLLFGYHTSTSSSLAIPSGNESSSATGPSTAGTGSSSSASGSGPGGSGAADGGSSSGSTSTVTGSVVSTEWGPVQVRLTLTGDTISDVTVLQYPNGNPRDSEINAYALPILIDETKQSDSARIDMVSGATITSNGYIESLQSALDKAGA